MAELKIAWQSIDAVSEKPKATVTGEAAAADRAKDEKSAEPTFRWTDKPYVVYVCDDGLSEDGVDKIEDVILKDEKVALAFKAFRAIRMTPEQAAADPLLAGEGRAVPRMLVVDPVNEKVKVLEKGRLKGSGLYRAMTRIANRFYEEKLDKVVDKHLKILTEQDQLANAEKVLVNKEQRLADEDGRSAEREREEIAEERKELDDEMKVLNEQKAEMWALTPRHKAA